MRVSGDNEIGLAFHRAGQELVIRWVIGDSICFVDVLGDHRLCENQPEEPPECFLPRLEKGSEGVTEGVKSLVDSWDED